MFQPKADVITKPARHLIRKATAGSLFIPLVAENDGHDYSASAIANGATATLWQADHGNVPTDIPAIIVPDTLDAFQS